MKQIGIWVTGLLAAAALTGCEYYGSGGGGNSTSQSADVAGTWNGTGQYRHGVSISKFRLSLSQNGNALSGSYSIKRGARDEMNGSISGSAGGGRINMTMHSHGHAEGSYSGNSMNLTWTESGFGGADFTGPRDASVRLSR